MPGHEQPLEEDDELDEDDDELEEEDDELDEEELLEEEDELEEDVVGLHLKKSGEQILLPGKQQLDCPFVQLGANEVFVHEALCPGGQKLPSEQLKQVSRPSSQRSGKPGTQHV